MFKFCGALLTFGMISFTSFATTKPNQTCPELNIDRAGNRNAQIALEEYRQTNDRTYSAYRTSLGQSMDSRIPTESWLDSGAGFGLAPLEALRQGWVKRAVVVNAQDALGPLRARDFDWFRTNGGNFQTARLTAFAGYELRNRAMSHPERGAFRPNGIEIMVEGAAEKLAHFEASGAFKYEVGLAEHALARSHRSYTLVTDVFGAYFYSARRPELIAHYYARLADHGEALVITHARDIRFEYDAAKKTHNELISEYGPISSVRRTDGGVERLEDYLVRRYPSVFSMVVSNEQKKHQTARHDVLVMKRDPRITSLDALLDLKIEGIRYGTEGMAIQIPEVTYAEPTR